MLPYCIQFLLFLSWQMRFDRGRDGTVSRQPASPGCCHPSHPSSPTFPLERSQQRSPKFELTRHCYRLPSYSNLASGNSALPGSSSLNPVAQGWSSLPSFPLPSRLHHLHSTPVYRHSFRLYVLIPKCFADTPSALPRLTLPN